MRYGYAEPRSEKISGVQIRYQFTFEPNNHVLQDQSPFFQPANSQLVDHGIVGQAVNQVVEISVTDTKFT